MDATTVAVDLAKDIFEVALANRAGWILERKRLPRRQFERFIDGLVGALRPDTMKRIDQAIMISLALIEM